MHQLGSWRIDRNWYSETSDGRAIRQNGHNFDLSYMPLDDKRMWRTAGYLCGCHHHRHNLSKRLHLRRRMRRRCSIALARSLGLRTLRLSWTSAALEYR